MDRPALSLMFTHILEGYDIPKPETVVKLKADKAFEEQGFP